MLIRTLNMWGINILKDSSGLFIWAVSVDTEKCNQLQGKWTVEANYLGGILGKLGSRLYQYSL